MSSSHIVKCNGCSRKGPLVYNGEHWLPPQDWVRLYDDHKAECLDEHLCPKCRPKSKKKVEPGRPHFMRPMIPSPVLAKIVGNKPLPRTQVVKKLWAFMKANNLQCQRNRRNILVGKNPFTKAIFKKDVVSMFDITKIISKHLSEERS